MNSELLAPEKSAEIEVTRPMGNILELAIEKGASIDQMERLIAMQERFEANQARKAFVQAMADFKKEAIVIAKDKDNKQYGSKYTSMGELVNTVTPILGKHGISAEWSLDQTDGIRVGCFLTHALGHSGETKWMKVPQDSSGAKNPIQQIKSSITYARILTFEMACGLASKETNTDDDGNGAGKGMDQEEFDRYMGLISEAPTLDALKSKYFAALQDANALKDTASARQFTDAKEKRKRELA